MLAVLILIVTVSVMQDHSCCPGYYGHECYKCPGDIGSWCSNHGECQDGILGNGECRCYEGFHGTACEDCEPGRYGVNCSSSEEHAHSSGHHTQTDRHPEFLPQGGDRLDR